MNNLRQIRNILYQLKKDFPWRIQLRNIVESSSDKKLGVVTKSFMTITVNKAILLPTKLMPSFIYDLSFIAANKNFTYGGLFGAGTRVVIVDGRDIPSTFTMEENTQVLADKIVYVVKSIDSLVGKAGFLLTVTTLSNMEKVDEF